MLLVIMPPSKSEMEDTPLTVVSTPANSSIDAMYLFMQEGKALCALIRDYNKHSI